MLGSNPLASESSWRGRSGTYMPVQLGRVSDAAFAFAFAISVFGSCVFLRRQVSRSVSAGPVLRGQDFEF